MTTDQLLNLLATDPLPYVALGTPSALQAHPAAFDRLMREGKAQFRRILKQDPKTVTFASVVRATLDIEGPIGTLWGVLGNHHHTHGTETTRQLIQSLQPKLTAFFSTMSMSPALYALLKRVKARKDLTAMEKRSLYLQMRGMEFAGVHLPAKKQKRLRTINKQLGAISEKFSDNGTQARRAYWKRVTDRALLGEMPEHDIAMAAEEAKTRKVKGWVFTLAYPSYSAVQRYCTDRTVREALYRAHVSVASSGTRDNRPLIVKILQRRQEKARLLGYRRYADYAIDDRMAGTVATARGTIDAFLRRCRTRAKQEVRELKAHSGIKDFQWWDLGYAARRLREERYSVNERELMEYFPMEKMIEGSFDMASTLFGLSFKELKAHSRDVREYAVWRGGKRIGYLYLDLDERPAKRAGAWSACVTDPIRAPGRDAPGVVINVGGFGRAAKGKPRLLKHGEVVTLFHEFGHAVHALLAETPERNLHGMHVEWDFVELPSQLFENWCWERDALRRYAHHYRTGKPIPDSLQERMLKSRVFLQAMNGLSQGEFSTLDMVLHTVRPPRSVRELDALCAKVSQRISVLPTLNDGKRHADFHHIFSGGYAAAYYSYLWAEILEADVFERFLERGMFNRPLGEKLRKEILSVGASRPAMASFCAFMGRKPDPHALLRRMGLA